MIFFFFLKMEIIFNTSSFKSMKNIYMKYFWINQVFFSIRNHHNVLDRSFRCILNTYVGDYGHYTFFNSFIVGTVFIYSGLRTVPALKLLLFVLPFEGGKYSLFNHPINCNVTLRNKKSWKLPATEDISSISISNFAHYGSALMLTCGFFNSTFKICVSTFVLLYSYV